MPKQSFITDFFKSKPKQQSLITDFFKLKYTANTSNIYHYNHKQHYKKSRQYLNTHKLQTDAAATRGGYYFCAIANFTEYSVYTTMDRCIFIDKRPHVVWAGTLVASATIDDNSALEHIHVEPILRRQGIGKALIRFINKHDQQFHVYAGTEHNSRYRLTEEGAGLIRACQHAGILQHEQVILGFVPPSPSG